MSNKGNDCFLNVCLQSFWHLDEFRSLMLSGLHTKHALLHPGCLHCCLTSLFSEYKYGDVKTLPSWRVRKLLADLTYVRTKSEGYFKLGKMADCNECFEQIIYELNYAEEKLKTEKSKSKAESIIDNIYVTTEVHRHLDALKLFQYQTCTQRKCIQCGASSEPLTETHFNMHVYASEIANIMTKPLLNQTQTHMLSLMEIALQCTLKKSLGAKDCPDRNETNCQGSSLSNVFLLSNAPPIFVISITWPAEHSNVHLIASCLQLTSDPIIHLNRVFKNTSKTMKYKFKGMICYYGNLIVLFC